MATVRRVPAARGAILSVLAAVALALGVWLLLGRHAFANYDLLFALLWGEDLGAGRLPDLGGKLTPTPHPLSNLVGLAVAPLGFGGAEGVAVALVVLSLGAIGVLAFHLGAHLAGPAAGALAAAIVLTREPVLSFGLRGYYDLPYVALLLGAVLLEVRRGPRAGLPVLLLIALAGLWRPEAWVFAVLYAAWAAWPDGWGRRLHLLAVAVAPALLWFLADLLVTGDPLFSLTGAQEDATDLGRPSGPLDAVTVGPRRIGEIVREPVLLGLVLALGLYAWHRRRGAPRDRALEVVLVAGAVALAVFVLQGFSGTALLGRYLLAPAALACVLAAAVAFGWRGTARDAPDRRPRLVAGGLVLAALAVFVPAQAGRLDRLAAELGRQEAARASLHALTRSSSALRSGCAPLGIPNHRLRPNLAWWLGRDHRTIRSAQDAPPVRGLYVDPATDRVRRATILDRRDPEPLDAAVPARFRRVDGNADWDVYARGCDAAG